MDPKPLEHHGHVEKTRPSHTSGPKDLILAEDDVAQTVQSPRDENNPLNWPYWKKVYIVLFLSGLSAVVQMGAALINPALRQMAEELGVTVEQASYNTTTFLLLAGVSPMFLVPFSKIYGRRCLYLVFTPIAAAAQVGSGAAATYGGLITARVFYGIGSSIPLGIGAATICDLFPQGERGLYMGIYTLCVNNGPHIAPVIGGYIALNLSWRWTFYVPGIIIAGLWVIMIFTFPETLYSRHNAHTKSGNIVWSRLLFVNKQTESRLKLRDFIHPYRMIQYWAVVLPSIYWMTSNTYGSPLFAVTGSHLAAVLYDFDVAQTGLLMGLPLTIGCMIGEALSGKVSDVVINRYAKRHNGYRKPEIRLALLPGCLALLAGVVAYGPCVQDHKPWIALAVCMAVAGFGVQVGATMVYTYTMDCYKAQSAEIGAVLNLFKSVFAFNIGFYALPFSEAAGYNVSFPVFGAISAVTLLPIVWLWFNGERIRQAQGAPKTRHTI